MSRGYFLWRWKSCMLRISKNDDWFFMESLIWEGHYIVINCYNSVPDKKKCVCKQEDCGQHHLPEQHLKRILASLSNFYYKTLNSWRIKRSDWGGGEGLGGTIIDKILKSALYTFCTLLYNESYRFQKDVIYALYGTSPRPHYLSRNSSFQKI